MNKSLEKISGIVERITFHNESNGWTVLKVKTFRDPQKLTTVLVNQVQIFAGATMDFWGEWVFHQKHGDQFKASQALEKKPATSAALEKYLGSGLIFGVGPETAKKIVKYFGDRTLNVFESDINELIEVPGIADKKLAQIKSSWEEHKSIRDVMIFLQGYGISTLFATKIFKAYGANSIKIVTENPYRLAHDIYGIGFFSADKIALAMGIERTGVVRIEAAIKHVLMASRDEGHCYLTENQIYKNLNELLKESIDLAFIINVIQKLLSENQIKQRNLESDKVIHHEIQELSHANENLQFKTLTVQCYYSNSLYFDEKNSAEKISQLLHQSDILIDSARIKNWVQKYCEKDNIQLSDEQYEAVVHIPQQRFSILTGGPGCGKTTCTKVLVKLLQAMKKTLILAAPTGRAAQRMSEVIGLESKTLHRLLEWLPFENKFKKNEEDQLDADFIIVDETSMLDISLTSSLLKATKLTTQILFIGDPDQLPSVGAGHVLFDLLANSKIKRFALTKIFRQAESSYIIKYAHQINQGLIPKIPSPLKNTQAFFEGHDCLFFDSEEASQEQTRFIQKVNSLLKNQSQSITKDSILIQHQEQIIAKINYDNESQHLETLFAPLPLTENESRQPCLNISDKFLNTQFEQLISSQNQADEFKSVIQNIHPWSTLHHGLTPTDTILRLYTKTIPEWFNQNSSPIEIQILSPQVRGTMGTVSLNEKIQNKINPSSELKKELKIGGKILRENDRIIQIRNNYDLDVFNGDIGYIKSIDTYTTSCEVEFKFQNKYKIVKYSKEDLIDLNLAYAITIHKSQGSEFSVVIIPVMNQHFNMLFRNLIYTGLTRAKKLAIFVGSRKALVKAIKEINNQKRQTALTYLID